MASVSKAGLTSDGGLVAAVLSDLVLDQLYDPTDLSALMRFVPFGSDGSGPVPSLLVLMKRLAASQTAPMAPTSSPWRLSATPESTA